MARHYKPGFPPSSAECSSSHLTRSTDLRNLSSSQPESTNSAPVAFRQTELFSSRGRGACPPLLVTTALQGSQRAGAYTWPIAHRPFPRPPLLSFASTSSLVPWKRKRIAYYLYSRPQWIGPFSPFPRAEQVSGSPLPCATATLITRSSRGWCPRAIPFASLQVSKRLFSV